MSLWSLFRDWMNTTPISACHWDMEAGQEEEYITLHGIYNLLITQVYGRYRVFDAEVIGSGKLGRGREEDVGMVQAEGHRGRDRRGRYRCRFRGVSGKLGRN